MRNEIAEWVLSQAAPPEQARTILGDLLEAQLGPVKFWVAVVRATMSIAGHQPWRVLKNFLWLVFWLTWYWYMEPLSLRRIHPHLFPAFTMLFHFAALGLSAGTRNGRDPGLVSRSLYVRIMSRLSWPIWFIARQEPSVLAAAVFWIWLLKQTGWPTASILLSVLPLASFVWWLRWPGGRNGPRFASRWLDRNGVADA